MRFVTPKTVEQQDIQSLHRIRSGFIQERTALANKIRGLLMKYGIIIAKGISHVRKLLPAYIEDAENELSHIADVTEFKNGRHLSAFFGLVPRQQSSGNKQKLLGISKRGNSYIRTLLIHGARSAILASSKKKDPRSLWVQELVERVGQNKAAVALANKNARIVYALIANQTEYRKVS
jgi:transposase